MNAPAEPAEILRVVAAIIARVTARAQPGLAMDSMLDEIDGVDSLRLLETVALAEEHFGVTVETGGLEALETVGDIVRLIGAPRAG